jgi:hypothetical protein
MTSSGTTIPVLLPLAATVVSNVTLAGMDAICSSPLTHRVSLGVKAAGLRTAAQPLIQPKTHGDRPAHRPPIAGAQGTPAARPGRCARAAPKVSAAARLPASGVTPAYGASLNGGYLSVTRVNAYAITRLCQRMTPCTKSNIPLG